MATRHQLDRIKSKKLSTDNQVFKLLNCNARSIINKLHFLHLYIAELSPDIVTITESWSNLNHPDALLSIPGYSLFRSDRNTRGGGVLLYVSSRYHSSLFEPLSNSNFCDSVWCVTKFPNNSVALIGAVYRPPNSSFDNDQILFENLRLTSSRNFNFKIIAGDFNYPGIDWQTGNYNNHSENFINAVTDAGLHQCVIEPTRHNSVLDLIFTSNPDLITRVDIIEPLGSSDHNMVLADLSFNYGVPPTASIYPRFDYKRANWEKYRSCLENFDWSSLFNSKDPDTIWAMFHSAIMGALHSSVPLKVFRHRSKPLWITAEVQELKKKRREAEKTYLINRTEDSRRRRNHAANILKCVIRRSVKDFEYTVAINENPKLFWNYVKAQQRSVSTIGPLKDPNSGDIVHEPEKMAQIFSDFYQSVFTNELLPAPTVPSKSASSLDSIDFPPEMINLHLMSRNSFASPGPDGLQYICFKEAAPLLLPLLSRIFSYFFSTGSIPSVWKHALVSPIYKTGSRKIPSNYRPISLTCTASKLMECVIRQKMWEFWDQHSLIKSSQFGFRNSSACSHQLLKFFEDVTSSVDRSQWVDAIYLDFEKAFNTVPHQRLLSRLASLGIQGKLLTFFGNFLQGRSESVVIHGTHSTPYTMKSGVPQGSVIGPDLFVAYINGIDDAVSNSVILKYADDIKLHINVKKNNPGESTLLLQSDIDAIGSWAKDWQLRINPSKSTAISFGSSNPITEYHLNNSPLRPVDSVRDLGVLVSSDLKFHSHIRQCSQKAHRALSIILRTFISRDPDILLKLYKAYVRPHLEYATPVWNPISVTNINILERVQRRFTRCVRNLSHLPYSQRLSMLNLTTLKTRRHVADLTEVFKIFNSLTPLDSSALFPLSSSRTRGNSLKIFKSFSRLQIRNSFFSQRIVDSWNSLPQEIVESSSPKIFKKRLYLYLS